ncbi:MAG: hypothetical protein JXA20_20580 [Spirochaetes bacterium]|nr:hypothetical protein [Spirochaetota bacterium]
MHRTVVKIAGIALLAGMAALSCRWGPEAPPRAGAIADLLIRVSDLPEGWRVDRPPAKPLPVDGEIVAADAARVIFRSGGPRRGTVVHRIYRFRRTGSAAREFWEQLGVRFSNPSLAPPAEPGFRVRNAGLRTLLCGPIGRSEGCHYMAAYEEYLVICSVIIPGSMDYAAVRRIVASIDRSMGDHLRRPPAGRDRAPEYSGQGLAPFSEIE